MKHFMIKGMCIAASAMLMASTSSFGATVEYLGPINKMTGLGHGTVLEVLNLRATGNGTEEAGSVRWGAKYKNGRLDGYGDIYNDIPAGDNGSNAETQGKTWTVADLKNLGGVFDKDHIGIVFNITEADKELTLREFTLYFQNANGTSVFGTASFTKSGTFKNLGGGQGQGDHLFQARFDSTDSWITSWLNGNDNRLGMYVRLSKSIQGVSAGSENFSVGPIKSFGPPPAVPLPASVWLGGLGIVSLACRQWLSRCAR